MTAPMLLAGGYRNEVWKVRAGQRWLVEKRYAEDPGDPNPMYPNLPDSEAAVLVHLASTGSAPQFVSYTPPGAGHGAQLVYEYVPGTMWRRGVADVARVLHEVHHGPTPQGVRTLHGCAAEARRHGDEMVAGVPASVAVPLVAVRPVAASEQPPRRRSLVHTDCGPGNLLRSRHGLVLIDWQCPGVGDATEDVTCFLSPAMMILYGRPPHTRDATDAFLQAYASRAIVARYLRDGGCWHYRIAAYCLWRAHRLAESQPTLAALYRRALAAEIQLLSKWGRR